MNTVADETAFVNGGAVDIISQHTRLRNESSRNICRLHVDYCLHYYYDSTGQARSQTGIASVYGNGDGYAGRKTANGERMNPRAMTAAHRTLPFGTRVAVVNKGTVSRSSFVSQTADPSSAVGLSTSRLQEPALLDSRTRASKADGDVGATPQAIWRSDGLELCLKGCSAQDQTCPFLHQTT